MTRWWGTAGLGLCCAKEATATCWARSARPGGGRPGGGHGRQGPCWVRAARLGGERRRVVGTASWWPRLVGGHGRVLGTAGWRVVITPAGRGLAPGRATDPHDRMLRMFGLLHVCSSVLDPDLLARWRTHLCGLCLTLRDHHGQPARSLTNTDAVALAVLVNAQSREDAPTRTAGPCPLRGFRTGPVIIADDESMRLAATASVTLAAGRVTDHTAERRHRPPVAGLPTQIGGLALDHLGPVVRRRVQRDGDMARRIDASRSLLELDGQAAQEAAVRIGDPIVEITTPSARAAGRIFAASGEIAGRPANVADLMVIGEAFGSLAHLLDAVEDLDEDARRGVFNPIAATGTSLAVVRRECGRLVRRIRRHVERLELDLDRPDARLARCLLVEGTHRAVHRAFAAATDPAASSPAATAPGRSEPPAAPPGPGPVDPTAPLDPGTPSPWPDHQPPPPAKKGPRPPFWPNIVPFAAVYCTGYACCAEHENHCTGERHPAACGGSDACAACGDCDCDCCDGCCCDCNC